MSPVSIRGEVIAALDKKANAVGHVRELLVDGLGHDRGQFRSPFSENS